MRNKKFMSLLLVAGLVLSLTACGGQQGGAVNAGGNGGNGGSGSNVSDNSGRDDNGDNGNDDNGGSSSSDDNGGSSSSDENHVNVGGGNDSGSSDSGSSTSSAKKFKADWEGIWFADAYSEFKGYLNVEAASDGNLKFTFINGDVTKEYKGEEQDYDEANYDYGSYITANVRTSDGASFSYSLDPDYVYINFDGNVPIDADTTENMWLSLSKFRGGYHIAPDSYDDSDRFGAMSRTDADDASYYYADTEDYIIQYYKSSSLWDGNDSIGCEQYTLTSFNEDGVEIGERKVKYIFENPDDAKRCYDHQKESYSYSDDYKFYLSGNIVYQTSKSYNDTTKLSAVYNWYLDCHYAFSSTDSSYLNYYYISKPISKDDYSLSFEDVLYYRTVYGSHHCLDTKDANMGVEISEYYTYLYVSDYSGDQNMRGSGRIVKIDGNKVYTITMDNYYNWVSSNKYEKALIIQEFDFGKEECTVTEYQFKVDDPATCGINLSNYKDNTADAVITHRFDMTRTAN